MSKKITVCAETRCKLANQCAKFERFENITVSDVIDEVEFDYIKPELKTDCLEYENR